MKTMGSFPQGKMYCSSLSSLPEVRDELNWWAAFLWRPLGYCLLSGVYLNIPFGRAHTTCPVISVAMLEEFTYECVLCMCVCVGVCVHACTRAAVCVCAHVLGYVLRVLMCVHVFVCPQ